MTKRSADRKRAYRDKLARGLFYVGEWFDRAKLEDWVLLQGTLPALAEPTDKDLRTAARLAFVRCVSGDIDDDDDVA